MPRMGALQGTLRVSRFNPFEGWVGSESVGEDILISGRLDMNRAIDGACISVVPSLAHCCATEGWGYGQTSRPLDGGSGKQVWDLPVCWV